MPTQLSQKKTARERPNSRIKPSFRPPHFTFSHMVGLTDMKHCTGIAVVAVCYWPPLASMGTGKRLSCDGLHVPSSRDSGWLALVSIRPPASLAPIWAPLRSVVSHRSSGAVPAQHGRQLISNLAAIQLLNRDYLHAHKRVSLCLLITCVSKQTSSSRWGLSGQDKEGVCTNGSIMTSHSARTWLLGHHAVVRELFNGGYTTLHASDITSKYLD